MCGALAMSWPCGVEQRAGEIQALLDVHRAARCWRSVTPICSAMAMNRLLKISSSTGSARVVTDSRRAAPSLLEHQVVGVGVSVARHPRSIDHGGVALADDGGSVRSHRRARSDSRSIERRVEPGAIEEHRPRGDGRKRAGARREDARGARDVGPNGRSRSRRWCR